MEVNRQIDGSFAEFFLWYFDCLWHFDCPAVHRISCISSCCSPCNLSKLKGSIGKLTRTILNRVYGYDRTLHAVLAGPGLSHLQGGSRFQSLATDMHAQWESRERLQTFACGSLRFFNTMSQLLSTSMLLSHSRILSMVGRSWTDRNVVALMARSIRITWHLSRLLSHPSTLLLGPDILARPALEQNFPGGMMSSLH
jgi:hypothetical protein